MLSFEIVMPNCLEYCMAFESFEKELCYDGRNDHESKNRDGGHG